MLEILFGLAAVFVILAFAFLAWRVSVLAQRHDELSALLEQHLEARHREMLQDLHQGLADQGERVAGSLADSSDRLRNALARELRDIREALQALQLAQNESLARVRETTVRQLGELAQALQARQEALRVDVLARLMETLAEQGRAEQELIQGTMRRATEQLAGRVESLTRTVEERLELIGGKVSERLDEGFRKTNETFANVMARLAVIDEAQKKIEGLTGSVVSLQELLGDKRSRGAFGEVQLEGLVRNILPASAFSLQHTLSNGNRVDCLLRLPAPTGSVAVDSKFPLENFSRMLDRSLGEGERALAQRDFKADVRRHVDDIARKYIVPGETGDGAVMFVPAEAVFAEIHGRHADLVEFAQQRRVWIVSPTTLMAVLNTARAVLKDVETRRQVHVIRDALARLGGEFARFDERMRKLAEHIRQAHEDAQRVQVTSQKISQRFAQIEAVELEGPQEPRLQLVEGARDEREGSEG